MSHVRRAFNVIKGVSRGLSQDMAAAKVMRDSFVALRSKKKGILESALTAVEDWVMAGDIQRRFAAGRMTDARRQLIDQAVTSARWRRGAMLGAGALYGVTNIADLTDRTLNPNRGFFQSPTGRFDLPLIPFL